MSMHADTMDHRPGDLPPVWAWVAAGLVVAGAVGAAVGCARWCGRPGYDRPMARPRPVVDSAHVTPPHGDVLDV
jgi:hypothetical protein